MIISFVNQKGGVGKTTAAINIGAGLARRNQQLILLDMDPQGSAAMWQAVEGNQAFNVIHQPAAAMIPSEIEGLSAAYDYVIIDVPPSIDGITRKILALSHMAIIPVSPSSLDIWSCKDTLKMVEEVQKTHPVLKAKFLINRKIPGTRTGREIRGELKVFNVGILKTELCQRVAYVESMKYGVSVMQMAPGSKAADEIEQLCDEIVDNPNHKQLSNEMDIPTAAIVSP